ncbi:MAG: S1C family serine protease [Thermoplasmatota archaeon]
MPLPLPGSAAPALGAFSNELSELVAAAAPAVVEVGVLARRGRRVFRVAGGTGFLARSDGILLTNQHVVGGGSHLEVTFSDGTAVPAQVVGVDRHTDLAVIEVENAPSVRPLPLATRSPVLGEVLVAVGSPFGFFGSVSLGIVSGVGRSLRAPTGRLIEGVIQTDAAINPGNSGGPLLRTNGEVVGVATALLAPAQNISLAIPAATAQFVMDEVLAHGYVRRAWLGIAGQSVILRDGPAVLIEEVAEGSPAEEAGLLAGDVLVRVDGAPAEGIDGLVRRVGGSRIGEVASIEFLRNRTPHRVSARLKEQTDNP